VGGGDANDEISSVWKVQRRVASTMFSYKRLALWLAVLLVPGGFLLLPLLLADMRRKRVENPTAASQTNHPEPRLAA